MSDARRIAAAVLTASVLGCLPASAPALEGVSGGTQAPGPAPAGARVSGSTAGAAPIRPQVAALSVPTSASPGPPPRIRVRVQEAGVRSVYVQVIITSLATHHQVLTKSLGWSQTGRTLTVTWPASARLSAGS